MNVYLEDGNCEAKASPHSYSFQRGIRTKTRPKPKPKPAKTNKEPLRSSTGSPWDRARARAGVFRPDSTLTYPKVHTSGGGRGGQAGQPLVWLYGRPAVCRIDFLTAPSHRHTHTSEILPSMYDTQRVTAKIHWFSGEGIRNSHQLVQKSPLS